MQADPNYVRQLESLPKRLRDAWLYGRWDVFEGQFFPEFRRETHVVTAASIPPRLRKFVAFDYGLDMLAALLVGVDEQGDFYILREVCRPDLTLRMAAETVVGLCEGATVEYAVASPDLWNRRQDSGRSGFEIMQAVTGMPPMRAADDRRIPGWRVLREYLNEESDTPRLRICESCASLIESLPLLLTDVNRPEDASGEPHAATHAPEALRYAVMSRCASWESGEEIDRNFRFLNKNDHDDRFF